MVLNSKVQWNTVLDLANVTPDSNFLPCNCTCPNCSNNLTIYKDITSTSTQWFYCKSCELAGDTIELLAAYMKLGLMDTINFLVSREIISNDHEDYPKWVAHYLYRQVGYRNKVLSFWRKIKGCEERIVKEHMDILSILNINGGHADIEPVRNIFGFSNKVEVLKNLVVSNSTASVDGGSNRVFVGKAWKNVCLIPSFDMPGRIKSFLIFGNIESGSVSVIIRHIAYKTWNQFDKEPGLLFLEEAVKYDDRSKVVVTDTVQGLNIVIDYLDKYKKFPPILVTTPDKDKISTAWKTIVEEGKEVIVSGQRAVEIVSLGSDAYISEFSDVWDSPWVGSSKWILKTIENKKKQTLVETSPKLDTRKRVIFDKRVYEEKKEGITKNDSIVMDAILKIDEISLEDSIRYYTGTLTAASSGISVKFKERAKKLDHRFRTWVGEISIERNMGHIMCKQGFSQVAVKVAVLLNPPKSVVYNSPIENPDYPLYKFSKYKITKDGEVINVVNPVKGRDGELCSDERIDIFEKDVLGDEKNGFAWAIIVSCISNLMSKVTNKPRIGIGVEPDYFDDARKVALLLGSYEIRFGSGNIKMPVISKVIENEARLNLPVLLIPCRHYASIHKYEIEQAPSNRNCIIKMNEMSLYGARTITRWAYIRGNTAHVLTNLLESACKKISINFLTWLIKSNYKPEGADSIKKAIDALSEWCRQSGITLDGLHKGINLIDHDLDKTDDRSKADAFKTLMGRFMNMDGFVSNGKNACKKEVTWIACRDFYNMCKKGLIPITDRGTLAKALLDTKTIKSYEIYKANGKPSWMIANSELEAWENKI